MFQKFRLTNRIATKMILAFLLVILIPTFFTSASFYRESTLIVKKNVRVSTVQIAKQTADSLSSIFNIGSDTSDFIFSDPNVQNLVMNMNTSLDEQNRMQQQISTLLNNIVYSNSFVKMVYLLKEDGNGWGSGVFYYIKLKKVRLSEQEWVKEAKRNEGALVWQGLQYDSLSGAGDNPELVLPVGRVLKDFHSMENIGLMQLNLNGQSILSTIEQLKLGKTGKFFVVDAGGNIMIDSDLKKIGQRVDNPDLFTHITSGSAEEFEFSVDDVPYYGVKQMLSNGWTIVGTVPVREITGQLDTLQMRIMLSSGLFAMLAIAIGLLMAGWVTNPIKRLTRDMRNVQQGDLKVRSTVRSSDEIGLLSKQFNKMLEEIEQLMHQVEKEQNEKMDAELRAVMHRIHPHFLYNALSTIRWLIKSEQNQRAYQGLSALTRLLEANMGKNGNMIKVEEELDIIEKYLVILELRYEKAFTLELNTEPGTERVVIPRMLLQPLVENAIFHGIVPKKTNGRIAIKIHFLEESVEFTVEDNGLGVEEEKLKLLNNPEAAIAKGEFGIGLRHVYDTLRLNYAGGWEWYVSSSPGQGTTVRILLRNWSKAAS